MKITPSTRRQFIKTAATAVTAFNLLPRHVLGGPGFVAPNDKVNVALVGAGGRGLENLKALLGLADVRVSAVADPAEQFSLEAFYYKGSGGRKVAKAQIEKHYAAMQPGFTCAEYEDFRVMLDKDKSIDAILCATPDHLHAYVSITAMRAGRHVYCEKPLTHNLWEAREVAKVARETKRATQMGNQGHSTVGIRETVEHLQAGTIGTVTEVHAWVPTKRWNPALTGVPTDTPPVPAGLNWDLWLGPREARAYNPAYFPVAWRDFWAFGGSAMGDFGCHDLDAATWGLGLGSPTRVESYAVGPTDDEIAPHGCTIYYDFPATESRPAVRLTWHDGGVKPRTPEAMGKFPLSRRGVMFVGSKGVIQCDGAGGAPRIFPEALRNAVGKAPVTIKRSNGHHRDWIDACKGGEAASSNFDYGSRLTEITLLGVLSLRLRRTIEWDAANLKVVGVPEADPLIRGTYRKGWEIA
jgi:predicted dehydrogenase